MREKFKQFLMGFLINPKFSNHIADLCIWHQQFFPDGCDIHSFRDYFFEWERQLLVPHYDRAQQGLLTDQQAQAIYIEAGLRHHGIGQLPPGLAVAAGNTDQVIIATATKPA